MNNNLPFYGNTEDVAKNIAAITDSLDKLLVSGNTRDLGNETSENKSVIEELMAVTIDSMALDKNEINHALSTLATEAILISNAGNFELTAEQISQLQTHPLFGFIPTMNEDESGLLLEDIKENGFREHITITRNMEIVDGRARIEIYNRKNIVFSPTFAYYDGDENSILDFIMSKNLFRKNLNKGQQAVSALKLYEIIKERNQEEMSNTLLNIRKRLKDATNPKNKKNSRDQAAQFLGVSSSYIGKAVKVSSNDKDLLQKVFQNEMSLEKAYHLCNSKKNDDKSTSTNDAAKDKKEEFEKQFGAIGSIANKTIELLITLGVSENESQRFVLAKMQHERKRKNDWDLKSDEEKFQIYLVDFTSFMERTYPSDFEEFSYKIMFVSDSPETSTLEHKIAWLKTLLNEDEITKLDTCITTTIKDMTSVPDNLCLKKIIHDFISEIEVEIEND